MAFEASFNKQHNYLSVKYDKLPAVEELDSSIKAFLQSGRYQADVNILFDMTTVCLSLLDRAMIDRLLSIREKYPERGSAKIAILVSRDVDFGLGRMYGTLSERLEQRIMIFRDREQAELWIGES